MVRVAALGSALRWPWQCRWGIALSLGMGWGLMPPAAALPPPEEIPEEVLRTEIITEGRSPLTGEVLSAAEYAQLQATLEQADIQQAPDSFRTVIFLLQVRRVIKPVIPLLP
ncbi:MAG: hypothetical protein VKJ09_13355 [Leptolyngbya sp.]|nr:hypothetical protein [Leptolyngbya sp.]